MLKDFSKSKFDIIIAAGQSNCEGSGLGSIEEPYIAHAPLWQLNRDDTISVLQNRIKGNAVRGGFVPWFAQAYENDYLSTEREVLVIRAAVGGTGFFAAEANTWLPDGTLFLKMMDMVQTALDLNPENRIVSFLWHQGERDIRMGSTPEDHRTHVADLLNAVRDSFGNDFPIIAGDLVPIWKDEYGEPARHIAQITKDVFLSKGGTFVSSDGLTSNSQMLDGISNETIHFSSAAQKEFAKRYYQAFEEWNENTNLVSKKK